MTGETPVALPVPPNTNYAFTNREILSNLGQYCRLVGKLLYLHCTKLDICFTVHNLSQFVNQPYQQQLKGALYIVRYLKGTLH